VIFLNGFAFVKERFNAADEGRIIKVCRLIINQLLSLLGGALLASVNGLSVISPFGVAFAVSVTPKYLISACFGAAAGYVMSQDSLSALRYICAILCGAVLITLVRQFERIKKFRLLEACTSFIVLFLTSVTVLFAGSVSFESFMLFLGEACIGFAAAYIFTAARDVLSLFRVQRGLEKRDLLIAALCAFLLLLSVSEIAVFSVSFSRILTAAALLLMSLISPETGVAAAVGAGLIFSADSAVGTTAFLWSFSGLAVGIIGNVGKLFRTVLFFLTYTVLYAFFVASTDRLYLVIEVFVACIIIGALPEKAVRFIKSKLLVTREPESTCNQRLCVLSKLSKAANALSEIGECVDNASELLRAQTKGEAVEIYAAVRDEICSSCGHFSLCWTKNFSDCKKSFETMSETLRNSRRLSPDSLPRFLGGCCVKKQELTECFTRRYLEQTIEAGMRRQVDSIRKTTAEQLGGLELLLNEMSLELDAPVGVDSELADRVYTVFEDGYGIKPKSVVCTRDSQDRLKIEITLNDKPKKLREAELREELEAACGLTLSPPEVGQSQSPLTITYFERAKYRVEAAASRSVADSDGVCGDSYEGFYDGAGNYCAVLSDGMGTGLRAAVDSSLAVTMTVKLIKAGFSCESAVRLVNSAMLLRPGSETLSTLDIIKINLHTGRASFCKAGACTSLVKRKSRLSEVGAVSMPLGILRDISLDAQSVQLGAGDLVMMGSDGAFEYAGNAVKNAFSVSLDESVSAVSQRVLLAAKKARRDGHTDDITVIAIRLCEN
jgi:stage II sporulation protein E